MNSIKDTEKDVNGAVSAVAPDNGNAVKCQHCGEDADAVRWSDGSYPNLCAKHRVEFETALVMLKGRFSRLRVIPVFDPAGITVVRASTINDLWFKLLWKILETNEEGDFLNAYPTGVIQKGSFENQQSRLQFGSVAFSVEHPLIDSIVTLPEGSTLPAPTTAEKAQAYFDRYIVGHELEENETYTYGSRINISLWGIIAMLQASPVTNQAVIEVARPEDWNECKGKDGKDDPPCLRKIQFMVVPKYKRVECDCEVRPSQTDDGKCPACGETGFVHVLDKESSRLCMHIDFRSWDLYGGLPQNLAGLAKLQKFVSDEVGIPVGTMFAYCSGLHLYKYQREIAAMRTKLTAPEF